MALVSPGPSTTTKSAPEVPATASASASITSSSPVTPASSTTPLPPPPTSNAVLEIVNVPSYSRWFSWDNIHETEVRFLPEFFDGRKNPKLYMHYRNSIIKRFRRNPSSKITFTEIRKTLVGDIGSIRRVFDFLEAWGLINYLPSSLPKPLKWDDKESKPVADSTAVAGSVDPSSAPPLKDGSKRICSGCKSVCTIACFASDKFDLTLCARCYVRGNYRVGVSSSDFRRVEINEEVKTDWSEKETLQLLEAIMHFGDDWRRVAQHVGGKNEKDCITQFLKLPFGEEFSGYAGSPQIENKCIQTDHTEAECTLPASESPPPSKRMLLTPLADASNPIMAQASFMSALVGVGVAEAAAQGAIKALTGVEYGTSRGSAGSLARNKRQQDADVATSGDTTLDVLEKACLHANEELEKEELEVERAIYRIAEVKMKEIQDKIKQFEELDLQMEKEWQQFEQMKNLLFVDQLAYSFHKSSEPKAELVEENGRTN